MTGSNKSKNTSTSKDSLTESSAKGSVELSETVLGEAAGGAVFPSGPALGAFKFNDALKIEQKATETNLLLPAVQKP